MNTGCFANERKGSMRKCVDIRVEADETDLAEFVKVCGAIQYLGNIGAHRDILLSVDGDGSARFKFSIDGRPIPIWGVSRTEVTKFYLGE